MTAIELVELAKTLDYTAAWARHVATNIDAGREPQMASLREWLVLSHRRIEQVVGIERVK